MGGIHPLSQTRALLQPSQVNLCGNDTDIWSHCLSFLKRKQCPPPRDAAPASGPSISSFLQRLSPCLESQFDVFPGCFSVSTVTFGKERSTLGCGGPRFDPAGVVQAL